MFRILSAGAAVFALSAAAYSLTPQEDLTEACTESGNDAADCACAADYIVETLDETELAFMMATMEAETEDPAEIMAIAAANGMELSDIMVMGQKMQAAEPEMREACGIEELN
jgi:hypothetical protein